MIYIEIDSKRLDLYKDTKIAFSRKNNALGDVDNMELSYSQSFAVPATDNNNAIFELASEPLLRGDMMRVYSDARLYYDSVVIEGRLYVENADREEYKCVFLFGELLQLKAIKDAGKIADIYSTSIEQRYGDFYDTNTPNIKEFLWLALAYYNGYEQPPTPDDQGAIFSDVFPLPSISLKLLLDECLKKYNIYIQSEIDVDKYRIIPPKPIVGGNKMSGNIIINNGAFDVTAFGSLVSVQTKKVSACRSYVATQYEVPFLYMNANRWELEFGDDVSAEWYCVKYNPDSFSPIRFIDFVGDHSFDTTTGEVSGNGLAGTKISGTAGELIAFIKKSQWSFDKKEYGWQPTEMLSIGTTLTDMVESKTLAQRDVLNVLNHLPDVSVMDLLKTFIAVEGCSMQVTNGGNRLLLNFCKGDKWQRQIEDDELIDWGNVKRVCGDYARANNITAQGNGDDVAEATCNNYSVQNDTLEKEKTLYEIPFSFGNKEQSFYYSTKDDIVVKNIIRKVTDDGAEYEFPYDKFTLAQYPASSEIYETYLRPVSVQDNEILRAITNESTQVEIKIKMPLFEFIKSDLERTSFKWHGAKWSWTQGQWAQDIATFTLQKM